MTRPQESFARYLGTKKLKFTRERNIVLEEMFRTPGHLEADDLLFRLKRKRKTASRATVYRTLDLLVESGIVRKVDLGHDHSHYELVADHPHHEHMICLKCGRVIEFSDKEMEKALNLLCRRSGFQHASHRFEVFGRCGRCRKSQKRHEGELEFGSPSS
ncbi:MAG: Fur family transcriptional regulator [Candidatus Zixiibacteriota bacterium]